MLRRLWIALSLLLPLSALAQPSPEVRALHDQIVALQLDHALQLTQQQAQALLPILQNARSEVQAIEGRREASRPAIVAALTQAVTDLKSTGTISDATFQALQAARGTPDTMKGNMRSIWQQARGVLTPEQVQALETTRFGVRSPQAGNGPHGGRRHGFARRFQVMHAALSDAFLALVQARAG